MKKGKLFLVLFSILVVGLLLTGCGDNSESNNDSNAGQEETNNETKQENNSETEEETNSETEEETTSETEEETNGVATAGALTVPHALDGAYEDCLMCHTDGDSLSQLPEHDLDSAYENCASCHDLQ